MKVNKKKETIHQAIGQLQRLTDGFQRRRTQLANQVGLTEQQWLVLEEISTEHFIPSLFARNRESSQAAVSKIIRQLRSKGLIHVSISKRDGRQRRYALTAEGNKIMERIRALRERAIDSIWMGLDNRDLEQFIDFASKLIDSIDDYTEKEA